MATRLLYETAFDSSVARPVSDDAGDLAAETSRRLCSPDPPSLRASPACSRSSSDSGRSSRRSPFRKLFGTPSPREGPQARRSSTPPPPKEDKTFSPSVEFKKLDVGDEAVLQQPTVCRQNSADEILTSVEPSCSSSIPVSSKRNASSFSQGRTADETNPDCNPAARSNLWLDFSRAPKRQRRHLCLDGGVLLGQEDEEPTSYLLKQEWYHGSISRADAEDLLRLMRKGSFLVRCSEKLKRQYLLSLKSSRGVMHVKIVHLPSGRFVLSPTAQTFDSIPQLVQHFRTHVLSIREMSVYLTHPVPEKLL